MNLHFVLYTKPGCIQCHMTEKLLTAHHATIVNCYHGNPAETNLLDPDSDNPQKAAWSARKIDSLVKKTGLHTLPIVRVYQQSQLLDTWGGFRPEKIKQWLAKTQLA